MNHLYLCQDQIPFQVWRRTVYERGYVFLYEFNGRNARIPIADSGLGSSHHFQTIDGVVAIRIGMVNLCSRQPNRYRFCDEICHIYLATNVTLGETNREPLEFMRLVPTNPQKAFAMARSGEIKDALSALALLWAEPYIV